jgi:hypothetical protein
MFTEAVLSLKTIGGKCLIRRNFLVVRDIFISVLSALPLDSPGKKARIYKVTFRIIKRELQRTIKSYDVLKQKYERIIDQEKAEIYSSASRFRHFPPS